VCRIYYTDGVINKKSGSKISSIGGAEVTVYILWSIFGVCFQASNVVTDWCYQRIALQCDLRAALIEVGILNPGNTL
jgi:hypothetical protein